MKTKLRAIALLLAIATLAPLALSSCSQSLEPVAEENATATAEAKTTEAEKAPTNNEKEAIAPEAPAATDADLAAALAAYEQKINALFEMTEEQKKAWSVIGNICGTSWDTDFPMTKVSENVYESEVLALNATEEFKCRQGASWTVNYGQGFDGANIVVETSGNYIVRLTITGDKTATIELIAQ